MEAKNATFLSEYHSYIYDLWKADYLRYDEITAIYKCLKSEKASDHKLFEDFLFDNITQVDKFICGKINKIRTALAEMDNDWSSLSEEQKNTLMKQAEKTAIRALRHYYDITKHLVQYHHLNCFLIEKVSKKYEKLRMQLREAHHHVEGEDDEAFEEGEEEFHKWSNTESCRYYTQKLKRRLSDIMATQEACVKTYASMFRQTYTELAAGELEYSKAKEAETAYTRAYLGMKIGIVITLLCWLVLDAFISTSEMNMWTNPGLYVFSCAGGFLVYKLTWGLNVWTWSHSHINYISLFKTQNVKPNTIIILNETMTWYIIYFVGLLAYFKVNTKGSVLAQTWLSGLPPFVMVVVLFIAVMHSDHKNDQSRDLFDSRVWHNCLVAPMVRVTFRDNYAADVLTSFTKIIADALYASCWVVSGTFLQSVHRDAHPPTTTRFGSEYLTCTGQAMEYAVGLVVLFPLWIRFAQCMRNFTDDGYHAYPHLLNAFKYLLSGLVVVYGFFAGHNSSFYFCLIIITALFKWWWDVVMDWGLFDTWCKGKLLETEPGRRPFLRPVLLYEDCRKYYVCMVLDLILRFLWVASLAPVSVLSSVFHLSPGVGIFLGVLEVMRRAMWGEFRVEYEHVKVMQNNALGVRRDPVPRAPSVSRSFLINITASGKMGPSSEPNGEVKDGDEELQAAPKLGGVSWGSSRSFRQIAPFDSGKFVPANSVSRGGPRTSGRQALGSGKQQQASSAGSNKGLPWGSGKMLSWKGRSGKGGGLDYDNNGEMSVCMSGRGDWTELIKKERERAKAKKAAAQTPVRVIASGMFRKVVVANGGDVNNV